MSWFNFHDVTCACKLYVVQSHNPCKHYISTKMNMHCIKIFLLDDNFWVNGAQFRFADVSFLYFMLVQRELSSSLSKAREVVIFIEIIWWEHKPGSDARRGSAFRRESTQLTRASNVRCLKKPLTFSPLRKRMHVDESWSESTRAAPAEKNDFPLIFCDDSFPPDHLTHTMNLKHTLWYGMVPGKPDVTKA